MPKLVVVIRVRVPLDLHAVATAGSAAFAMATPLRVRELLAFAVREAIGLRAPIDKLERSLRRTLAGLERGDYLLTVDGRPYYDGEDVVVCSNPADVRFFLAAPAGPRRAQRSRVDH
ncbi:MAG: hypothetical protein ACYDHD_08770 [Vulcanimicrobiaceae bacterium]